MPKHEDSAFACCCLSLCILVLLVLVPCMITRGEPLIVTDHNWSRKVYVEQFKTVRKTGDSVPSDGRQVSSNTRVAFRQIGERNIPFCETYYTYDIDKWIVSYYLTTTGKDTDPKWETQLVLD